MLFFFQEIRKAFEAESKKSGLPPLLLTAGVTASKGIINDAYEVENITKLVNLTCECVALYYSGLNIRLCIVKAVRIMQLICIFAI